MPSDRLQLHYESKYADEHRRQDTGMVRRSQFPVDRLEACIHSLTKQPLRGDILELGAGSGRIARTLLRQSSEICSYTVTDLAEVRLDALRSATDDPRVRAIALNAEGDLSMISDRRYSVIIMVALIEHLIDPMGTMTRLRELVADDGFVYIDTPNIAKWSRRLLLMSGRFPSTASRGEGLVTYDHGPVDLYDEGHLHYFTFRSLRRMLCTYCGFRTVVADPYWPGRSALPPVVRHSLARRLPGLFSEVAVRAYPKG